LPFALGFLLNPEPGRHGTAAGTATLHGLRQPRGVRPHLGFRRQLRDVIPTALFRRTSRFCLAAGVALALLGETGRGLRAAAPESAGAATVRAADAAAAFLATLDDAQRQAAVFAFDDEVQRLRWSNLPVSMVKRAGLRMGDLKPAQREAALRVLAVVLSKAGYNKVLAVVEADEALAAGSPKGSPAFGRDEFFISFVGKPSATEPWMLQYGGHHLAVNATLHGQQGILTPTLIATQPAAYVRDGKTIRPMGRENDLAFELVNALKPEQRSKAVIGSVFRDLVLGPGRDGKSIVPEGVKGSELDARQRRLLLDLVGEWAGIIDETSARARMKEIESHLDDTWFAWSGPIAPGSAAYFRIQGPTVIIEYAPQNLGGVPTNHIHSIYRDPTNEYGRKPSGR
jgi:hypothetical protein